MRLIDFGVSKQGVNKEKRTTSKETCGTMGYMAPEVAGIDETGKAYSYECDWFSYGVLVYEICEHEMPFGREPEFESLADEYRQPDLIDEFGSEIPDLYDLLAGLLDWSPENRITGTAIKKQPYFKNEGADWELVDRGRMRSPMLRLIEERQSGSVVGDAASKKKSRLSVDLDTVSMGIADDLAKSQKLADLADSDGAPLSEKEQKQKDELEAEAFDNQVEGWQYVSEHALAREYVMGAADVISIV